MRTRRPGELTPAVTLSRLHAPVEAPTRDASAPPLATEEPARTDRAPAPVANRRGRLGGDRLALLALAAFCAALIAATWWTWGDLTMDTGYDLVAAQRTRQAEYPYLYFIYMYGPLGPALLSKLFAAFGTTIGVATAFGLVVALAIVGATYALVRPLAGTAGALLAAALVATAAFSSANNSFVMPHSLSAPLAVLLVAMALVAAAAAAREPRAWRLLLAGACVGAVALTRLEYTAAAFAAVGLWLVLRILDGGGCRTALRQAALVALPALAIPAVVYGLALTQTSAENLFTQNLYPVDFLREAGSVIIEAHFPLTIASFAKLAALLAVYAAGAGALVAAGIAIGRGGRLRTVALTAAGGAALAFLAAVAVRPEFVRFKLEYAYAWVPAGAWLAVGLLLWRFRRRDGRWSARAQTELLVLVATAVVVTKGYADFFAYPNPAHPQDAAYTLPFVGAFLAWLHLRELPRGRRPVALLGAGWLALLVVATAALVVGDARDETVTVRASHGAMTALPADGPAYQAAIDVIERESRPGDAILLAPQMTALYVMTDRANPLEQISLLPGTLPDAAAERRAIEALRVRDVQLVITDRAPQTTYEHGAFGETYARRLGSWIKRSFSRTAVLRGAGANPRTLDVWKRRQP